MWLVRDSIFIGLLEASPLILAAMGFTLIYYLNGFINFAYGESITFGAYFAVLFNVGLLNSPGRFARRGVERCDLPLCI